MASNEKEDNAEILFPQGNYVKTTKTVKTATHRLRIHILSWMSTWTMKMAAMFQFLILTTKLAPRWNGQFITLKIPTNGKKLAQVVLVALMNLKL